MAQDLRDFRNLQPRTPPRATPAAQVDEIDDTVPLDDPRANQVPQEAVRTQLINDLDKFVEQYDREEEERIRQVEEEQRRKEEDMRRWGEEQAKKRDELERTQNLAAASPDITITRGRALDLVRKQASQVQRESPSLARVKAIGELDGAMRAALQYLAELVKELNAVHPLAERPYEFIYLGKLPKVSLSEAFVDSRPRTIDGHSVTDHIFLRFRITPSQPARANLLGDDTQRCEEYLKLMKVRYALRVVAKNDFGKVTRTEVTVTGSLPCEVHMRADYDTNRVAIELTNVRHLGRRNYQLSPKAFADAVDDLARYLLGADDDFENLARAAT